MARKRKSSEREHQGTTDMNNGPGNAQASSVLNGQDLNREYGELCADLQIESHAVKQLYQYLWWKNREQLKEEIINYFRILPTTPGSHLPDTRTALLLDRLQGLRATTPRSSKIFRTGDGKDHGLQTVPEGTQSRSTTALFDRPRSRSPSPSALKAFRSTADSRPNAGIKASFKSTKAGVERPTSPVKIPTRPASPKSNSRDVLRDSFINQPAPLNAQTSFASTVANTSFGQNSFWSQGNSQQSSRTDMTSFNEEMPPPPHPSRSRKHDSLAMSSLSTDTAEELVRMTAEVESSQKLNPRNETIRTVIHKKQESTGSSEYDTAPTSPLDDRADRARRSSSLACARRSSLRTIRDYFGPSSTSDSDYGSSFEESAVVELDVEMQDAEMTDAPVIQVDQSTRLPPKVSDQFAILDMPELFSDLPFELQWEVKRVLQTGVKSADELNAGWVPKTIRSLFTLIKTPKLPPPPDPGKMRESEVPSRCARLEWSTTKWGPICNIFIENQRKEISCSLQRWLGPDRVLYLDLPDLTKPPDMHKGRDIHARLERWIKEPCQLLGRKWYPFFLQPNKKKSVSEGRATAAVARLVLVAPGNGKSISDILDWALPFDENCHQFARKAYMRLELVLSRTVVAAVLEPGDFEFIGDKKATGDPDDRRFEDPKLAFQFQEINDPEEVMNDGCSMMHQWLAYQYAKKTGASLPPSLQIRAAGCKGLWVIDKQDRGTLDLSSKPEGKILFLATSQVKTHYRKNLEGCDEHTLSVNVVKATPDARPSVLHTLFLPILADRGVPIASIQDVVKEQVQREMDQFLESLQSPVGIRGWLGTRNEFFEARRRENGIECIGMFPTPSHEQAVMMLEAGFDPLKNTYLAYLVGQLLRGEFDLKKKAFKIQLPKSTTLWGIPDPLGCLEPGEVCVIFRRPFVDAGTNEEWWCLDRMDGLIARNPALAGWDIQKVRFVFKPELIPYAGHVIFSIKGTRPLAGKLSGGDYDGDTFWFTWEQKLVQPFKNAPVAARPKPEEFGIRKDKMRLADHIKDPRSESQTCEWLGRMALNRIRISMLGLVTLTHEQLIYSGAGVSSALAQKLVHLHDYLVDADKQGYDYTREDFMAWRKRAGISAALSRPRYWKFTRNDNDDKEKAITHRIVGEVTNAGGGSVIDTVYFDYVEPIVEDAFKKATDIMKDAGRYDADLTYFFNDVFKDAAPSSHARSELLALKDSLKKLRDEWQFHAGKYTWLEYVRKVRESYEKIQPLDPHRPEVKGWLLRLRNGPSTWDLLKASALARTQYTAPQRFMYSVAGWELCFIKSHSLEDGKLIRLICDPQYRLLKIRRLRKAETTDDFDDDTEPLGEELPYY